MAGICVEGLNHPQTTLFKNTFFSLGAAVLLLLLLLRWIGGTPTQAPVLFWAMSVAWPWLMGYALISGRGVSLSRGSPWGALLVMTTLVVGVLTIVALDPPMGTVEVDAVLVGFASVVLIVLCIGWWRLLRPVRPHAAEEVARPWLYIALAIIAAIGIFMDKLGVI